MLRSLVLILLIVNAAFFAWSKGWLNQVVGVQPDAQHEPQRIGQQIHADKIVVLMPGLAKADKAVRKTSAAPADAMGGASTANAEASSAASAPSPAASSASISPPPQAPATPSVAKASPGTASDSKDTKCVEAGPFNASEYASLEANLKPILPAGSWGSRTVAIQGMWLVYMGPYADADMLERKQAELRRIKGLSFEEVRTPAHLALGISLGRFNKQEDADAGLNAMRNRGIRTARIVTVRPPMEVQVLRVPRASVGTQVTLASMKLPQGKGFSACRP
ncbi:MAG: hypothetical protein EPO09_06095 [Aquabacterium sp.]|uniref:hypothetical protein n=1 Tax=Aquabacterium sp. TaxID=1872578 RepID=UPI0012158B82|nr:hypothetical protein [Aquabacterium sp.]TAK96373.1 MAG: hypothetical protein EPO09_06095 [Aquabacterium sp.]